MDYFIHWIDKYTSGYRSGATHATPDDGSGKSVCGIDYSKHHLDGGYDTTDELLPDCKKCLKIVLKLQGKEKAPEYPEPKECTIKR
jgi:hypothetical protein